MSARAWRVVLAGTLTTVLYAGTLENDFVWDDRLLATAPPRPSELFARRTGAYFRPLVMLSFHADRALWGERAAGYHLTNLLAHATTAVLVGELAAALGLSAGAALAATLVFVAHPVQTDAVSYVSGRTDVLCALLILVALLCWRRARRAFDAPALASAVAFAGAILCKESAAPLALVFWVPGAHPVRPSPRPVLPTAVATVWVVAYYATGGFGATRGGPWDRIPGILMTAVAYVSLLALPLRLHLERFVPVHGWSTAALLGGTVLLGGVVTLLVVAAHRVPGGLVLLAFTFAAYVPASGIVPVYPAVADRWLFAPEHFLYLPLVGLSPLVAGALAAALPAWGHRLTLALFVGLLAAWSWLAVDRNRTWHDEATLFRDALAYDPPTSRLWFNLGNLELQQGRLAEAGRLYDEALKRSPRDAAAHLNLGIVRQREGRLAEAEEQYRLVVEIDPEHRQAAQALATLRARRGARR